jgi:hypothetical protein
MCLFFVCVVLCLGRGLATSPSLVQGALNSVKWSWNWKIRGKGQRGLYSQWKRYYNKGSSRQETRLSTARLYSSVTNEIYNSYYTNGQKWGTVLPEAYQKCCAIRTDIFELILNAKNAVFWEVAPCRYYLNRRFGGTYRIHRQPHAPGGFSLADFF